MSDQRRLMPRLAAGIGPRPIEKDDVVEAIDHALHEVHAARRDLSITGFCMRQAELLRRIDQAQAHLVDLVQSGTPDGFLSSHTTTLSFTRSMAR